MISLSQRWAFGVVLLEMCIDGGVPLHQLTNQQLLANITSGWVAPQPPRCPTSLYKVMCKCWALEPTERPSFANLVEILSQQDFERRQSERAEYAAPSLAGGPAQTAAIDVRYAGYGPLSQAGADRINSQNDRRETWYGSLSQAGAHRINSQNDRRETRNFARAPGYELAAATPPRGTVPVYIAKGSAEYRANHGVHYVQDENVTFSAPADRDTVLKKARLLAIDGNGKEARRSSQPSLTTSSGMAHGSGFTGLGSTLRRSSFL
jgi:hypothetical protein